MLREFWFQYCKIKLHSTEVIWQLLTFKYNSEGERKKTDFCKPEFWKQLLVNQTHSMSLVTENLTHFWNKNELLWNYHTILIGYINKELYKYFPIMRLKESTIYKQQTHFHAAIKTPYQATLIKAEIRHYIYISVTKKAILLLYGNLPVNVSGPKITE